MARLQVAGKPAGYVAALSPVTEDAGTARTGVSDPTRLKAVADAELSGHLGDRGLDAVVATLKAACQVPMAVVNIVTVDTQTYAAESLVDA